MNDERSEKLQAQNPDNAPERSMEKAEGDKKRIITGVNINRYIHATRTYGKLITKRRKSAI
jgi:hypothetical protein